MSTTGIRVQLGLDATGVEAGAKKAEAALQRVGKAGTVSAGQIAAATRTLPAQFTDIATQLAGGGNPFLVLLQQGGQIKDSFGGVGNAVRGIAAAVSPVTLAVGGLASVVGTLAFSAFTGAKEAAQLRDVLTLTGNAAGLTADSLDDLTERVSASSQQTVGDVRAIAIALASTGRTSAKIFDSQALAIARLADLTGKSGADIAATFAGQLEAPTKFAAKLNEAYNFLSVADFKRIQQLEQSNKATEAAVETNDLLYRSLEGQKAQVGTLESAWDSFTKQVSRAKKALLDLGKPETMDDVIRQQRAQLETAQRQLSGQGRRGTVSRAGLAGLVDTEASAEQLRELRRFQSRQIATAAAISDAAAQTRSAIADLVGGGKGKGGKDDKGVELTAIQSAREQYRADFLKFEKDADRQIAKLAEDRARDADRAAKEQQRVDEQRATSQRQLLESLVDGNARAGAAIIEDERERGQVLIELDRQVAERRVREAGFTGARLSEALGLVNDRAAYAQINLDRQISASLRDANAATVDRLTDSVSTGILEGFRQGGSFADVFLQELKAQFAKTVLQPLIRPVVDAGNNILQDLLTGIARGISGQVNLGRGGQATAGDFFTGYTGSIDGFRASGGPVSAGGTYVVGERGRELLQMGNQSGRVVPNQALGPTVQVVNQITVDARADQAQVAQLVAVGVQRGNQAMLEHLRVRGAVT